VLTLDFKKSAFIMSGSLSTAGPSQTSHFVTRDGSAFIIVAENFNDAVCFFAISEEPSGRMLFSKHRCVSVPGAGAMAITEVDDTLVFVAASYHDNGWHTTSRVYTADARATGAAALDFREVQRLDTRGAHDAELKEMHGTLYLFFAEDRDESTTRIESSLFAWHPDTFFQLVQRIPTDGAHGAKFFICPGNAACLAIANFGDRRGQRYASRSEIWRKKPSDAVFSYFDAVDSHGATDVEHFVLHSRHFVAVANEGDIGKRLQQTSFIYELIADDRAHADDPDL
jgi:hypothetical protein